MSNFRNMLSCAHILAMDTKNLLDVCDSIRARFPDIRYNSFEQVPPQPSPIPSNLPQHASPKRQPRPPIVQEFYQNVATNSNSSERLDVAGNEQLYCNQVLPSEIGIYDNQAAIQEHSLRIVETESNSSSQKILST